MVQSGLIFRCQRALARRGEPVCRGACSLWGWGTAGIIEGIPAIGKYAPTGARSVAAYLEYWRAEMHLGGAPSSQNQQIAVIARRAGRAPEDVAELLRIASAAAQQLGVPAAQATHIIRELSRLKHQMQRTVRGTYGNR